MTRRVLIVDDDDTIRTSLAEALSDDGATTVRTAESADAALGLLTAFLPDIESGARRLEPARPEPEADAVPLV